MTEELEELFDTMYSHASFHDSIIQKINLDYVAQEAKLDFSICVGNPDSNLEKEREEYRSGRLIFSGLILFFIEPPTAKYNYVKGLWVADCNLINLEEVFTKTKPLSIPEDTIAVRFFINDWNAYIYVAAEKASFEWT